MHLQCDTVNVFGVIVDTARTIQTLSSFHVMLAIRLSRTLREKIHFLRNIRRMIIFARHSISASSSLQVKLQEQKVKLEQTFRSVAHIAERSARSMGIFG